MILSSVRVMSKMIKMMKPNGSMRANFLESTSGNKPTSTRPPSSGGSGKALNTAKVMLIKMPL